MHKIKIKDEFYWRHYLLFNICFWFHTGHNAQSHAGGSSAFEPFIHQSLVFRRALKGLTSPRVQLFSCTDGCRATLLRKSGDRCKGKLLTCARCECRYMYHLCTGKLHRLFCLSRNTEHKTSIRVTFPVHELSAGQLCRKSQILGCKWAQRL